MLELIGTAAVRNVVGTIINSVFSLFGGGGNNQEDLQRFLRILSQDFSGRVETIMRAAFDQQNLLEIRAALTSSAESLRTYVNSGLHDDYHLSRACGRAGAAYARLAAVANNLLSTRCSPQVIRSGPGALESRYCGGSNDIRNLNSPNRVSNVYSYNRGLQCLIDSLIAVAGLNILVLSARAEHYPGLYREIIARIDSYLDLAHRLRDAFIEGQEMRIVSLEIPRLIGCESRSIIIKDGQEIFSQNSCNPVHFNQRVEYERYVVRMQAGDGCRSANNINDAMALWQQARRELEAQMHNQTVINNQRVINNRQVINNLIDSSGLLTYARPSLRP